MFKKYNFIRFQVPALLKTCSSVCNTTTLCVPVDRPVDISVSLWKIGFALSIWEHVGLLWKICIGQFYTRGLPCQYYLHTLLLSFIYIYIDIYIDYMKLLIIRVCILLLSHSFILFRFYIYHCIYVCIPV